MSVVGVGSAHRPNGSDAVDGNGRSTATTVSRSQGSDGPLTSRPPRDLALRGVMLVNPSAGAREKLELRPTTAVTESDPRWLIVALQARPAPPRSHLGCLDVERGPFRNGRRQEARPLTLSPCPISTVP